MKHWKVCWMTIKDGIETDHNGFENNNLEVKAESIMEAYKLALPIIMMQSVNEKVDDYKIYDIGIIEEEVF